MVRKIKEKIAFNPSAIAEGALLKLKKEALEGKDKALNVLEFAEEILSSNGHSLFPAQRVILKFFYAGTKFNEDIRISDEDIEEIKSWDIPQTWIADTENNKLKSLKRFVKGFNENPKNNFFRDLVLVLGRRSGKSFLTSFIAVYEAYKLVMLKNPQKYYGIDGNIWIINTAVSGKQAETIIFSQILKFVENCAIFEGRISKQLDDVLMIRTDEDLRKAKKAKDQGLKEHHGSIILASGHSNSAALRGHAATLIMYDEVAHFVDTSGKASGDETYAALKPSTLNFQKDGDGRNIVISSPDVASGFFYHHYESCKNIDTALVFQIPTWNANPTVTRDMLDDEFQANPDRAASEYGAEFRRSGGNVFIPEFLILEAQEKRKGWHKRSDGIQGTDYYLHIDPAKNSDRWAFIVAHEEWRIDPETRQFVKFVVEDYSKAIDPDGEVLNPDEIMDETIIPLFSRFNIISVSCDTFFSTEQQIKLQKKGIVPREISYSGANKNKLYTTMKDHFIRGTIELCNDDQPLVEELRRITIDYTKKIPKIENPGNDKFCPWDDLSDCLCGVIDSMIKGAAGTTRLPKTVTVRTRM